MVELADFTQEADYWLEQLEAQFKRDVFERDKGVCVCGAPIQNIHHLLTRKKPRDFKGLPTEIRKVWTLEDCGFPFVFNPHLEINGRGLCLNHHEPFAHSFGRLATKLLMCDVLYRCEKREWQERSYWDWYHHPPFVEFLA